MLTARSPVIYLAIYSLATYSLATYSLATYSLATYSPRIRTTNLPRPRPLEVS